MSDTEALPPLLGRGESVPRRRWRWLLPLLLTLAVGSLAAVGVSALLRDDPGSPQRIIDRYLDSVEEGKTTEAYGLLCARFQRATPFGEFQRILTIEKRDAGGVTDHKVARVEKLANGTRVASYTVRRSDGDVIVDAALIREQGRWRVCGFKTRGPAK